MARNAAHYTTAQEELPEQIDDLDWHNLDNPPIQEAATLVYERLQYTEPGEKPNLDDILDEVPAEFRSEVMATMLHEQMQTQEHQANNHAAESTDDQKAAQHPAEAGLQHDLERTQHVLQYIESIGDPNMAYQLSKVMEESRNLELRQMQGSIVSYGTDPEAVHERYVQCILDIPEALNAKQALEATTWNTERLQLEAQHEVNRMAFRLNLEIIDRLANQISDGQMLSRAARERGISEEVVQELIAAQGRKSNNAQKYQNFQYPTEVTIKDVSCLAIIESGIKEAIKRGDEELLRELVQPRRGFEEVAKCASKAALYADAEHTVIIERALQTVAQWPDEQILDGHTDYHIEFADLRFKESNVERMQWLHQTNQLDKRQEITGDCVTRAINEATGDTHYGEFHQTLSDRVQTKFPERDADSGIEPQFYEPIYKENGMQPVLDTQDRLNHLMRKHLDIREIPTLFNSLFDDENPLTYIATSDGHAVAVVDGAVHDSWDSRDMVHTIDKHGKDGTLIGLWIKCDDEQKLADAREILQKYETVRRYDDALTRGRKLREQQLI